MASTEQASLKSIFDAVVDLTSEIQTLKTEQVSLRETITSEISSVKIQNNELQSRVSTCESTIDSVAFEVEALKQKQLKLNICIAGLPFMANENLHLIFDSLCKSMNHNIPRYSAIYRTHGQMKKAIIVQFLNDSDKFDFIKAKKIKRTVILEELQLGFENASTEILINHHLTPYFANLLYVARQGVKKGEIFAAWYTSKGIALKKTADANAIVVSTKQELQQFVSDPIAPSNKRRASEDLAGLPNKKAPTNTEIATVTPIHQTHIADQRSLSTRKITSKATNITSNNPLSTPQLISIQTPNSKTTIPQVRNSNLTKKPP